MAIVVSDPTLLAQLTHASESVEVRDPDGNYLGTFAPPIGKPPPGYKPPISDEEIARRRSIREGKPLGEILKNLKED